jgi:TolB-like protein/Tfp pilus assembly protein PilF
MYRFDTFELDTDRYELRQSGASVSLEPQVFALIAYLIANRDRMVSKDELIEKVWNGRLVSDSAISSRIKKARQALGDDGKSQRLILTVHGQGFRFIGKLAGGAQPASQTPQAASASSRPCIAVLPFVNLSEDAEQEYFSDAITQDLITNLSKHRWLSVVARNSAFAYKDRPPQIQQLVRELGVSYVVEGSVRRAGDRIRATVQLIDATTEQQIWSDRYDRELEDVFAVQDDITAKIAARLEPEIGASERQKISSQPNPDLKAWDCFHLGLSHFFRFSAEDNIEAQRLLQKSRTLDPKFGEAHAWWAYSVILGMVYWDTDPSPELLDAALEATQRALQIDDKNAVFYALKARVQLARGEYQSALMGNSIAIDLNPTLAAAHCGLADSLAYEGRYDEAIQNFEQALELSPNDPQRWAFLTYGALAHIFRRDFQTAIEWANQASEIPNCQFWTTAHKAVALAYLGEQDQASAQVAQLLREQPQFSRAFARKKLFYLKDEGQLDMYLQGLKLAGVS